MRETLNDLLALTLQIRRKNKTLIDYYIYPDPVPTKVLAYDPRLVVLESRIRSLQTLSYTNLIYLLDDSDAYSVSFLVEIIVQLLNAIHGFKTIFEKHYDRDLQERRPYETIYRTLEHHETQLKQLKQMQMTNPRRRLPEDLRPNAPSQFCRGAIQMINGRDRGRLSYLESHELLPENRSRLRAFGGAFLWWDCAECAYKLRYHISNSRNSNIHTTEEVREHSDIELEYRSTFLVKSHLFTPQVDDSIGARGPNHVPAAYGCLFCFANGKAVDRRETPFYDARDLAEHIAAKHKKNLPPSLMMEKFQVAVEERLPNPRIRRWELNFQ